MPLRRALAIKESVKNTRERVEEGGGEWDGERDKRDIKEGRGVIRHLFAKHKPS